MKVILLTDVSKLGRKYEIKEVSNGYAANFLFPKKLAELASKSKLKEIKVLKKRHDDEKEIQAELLAKNFESLEKATATVSAKANEQGHLFQGIHKDEIIDALKKVSNIDLHPDMVEIPKAIKAVGEFEIKVVVGDKEGSFKLIVNPE